MTKVYQISHQALVDLLDYDPATGAFVWKVARSNRIKAGSRAGALHSASGGRYISIGGEKFMAHRLAFFYVNKRWPQTDVRPIDGNYDNSAIINLQEVSRVELQHNRGKVATNTSGYAGVSPSKHGRWQAKITWNYKQISLGANFVTAEDASAAYVDAESRLKAASTDKIASVMFALLREKRQRAAWTSLVGQGINIGWLSFSEFAADVKDVPERRYAMSAIDPAKPIGPGNYRWYSVGDHPTGTAEGRRIHRAANKDRTRDKDFRRKYGIDYAEYQRKLIAQKGVCAICEQPETKVQNGTIRMLSVDHDHKTGAVRDLLCGNCNMAIGFACDDVSILQKAITYLRSHSASRANVVPLNPARDWLIVTGAN